MSDHGERATEHLAMAYKLVGDVLGQSDFAVGLGYDVTAQLAQTEATMAVAEALLAGREARADVVGWIPAPANQKR